MNHPDDEINRVFFRRSGMGGEAARRGHEVSRIWLSTRVGTDIVDSGAELQQLLLVRLIVMKQRVLGTDMDFDPVFDSPFFPWP